MLGPNIVAIEIAADGQQGVANDLRFEPPRAVVPEVAVGRIELEVLADRLRATADRPSLSIISLCSGLSFQPPRTSSRGEPFEQLGMRRPLALHAEIVGRADDPFAEMMLPEAVDDHPREQRPGAVLDVGHPVGQRRRAGRRAAAIGGGLRARRCAQSTCRKPGSALPCLLSTSPRRRRRHPARRRPSCRPRSAAAAARRRHDRARR